MSIYAVGDLHLSLHPDVNKPMDVFGPLWHNHVSRLYENWLNVVKEDDTVIIAGDVSWAMKLEEAIPDLEWLHNLPGKKVIIKGNHDLWWSSITKINNLFSSISFLQNTCYIAEGYGICGTRGWICPGDWDFESSDEKIYKREVMRLERSLMAAKSQGCDKIIGITHYPPTNERLDESDFTQLFQQYNVEIALYGHLHGTEAFDKGLKGKVGKIDYKLVSLDFLNCKPLLIKE